MALISCPECGRQISDRAASCPHCGCPGSGFSTNPSASPRAQTPTPAERAPAGRLKCLDGLGEYARVLALSPDGKLVLLHDRDLELWDVESGTCLATLKPQERMVLRVWNCGAFSADGRRVLAGDSFGAIHLFDIASGNELRSIPCHEAAVGNVYFSPDGHRAVTFGKPGLVTEVGDEDVRLWDLSPDGSSPSLMGTLNRLARRHSLRTVHCSSPAVASTAPSDFGMPRRDDHFKRTEAMFIVSQALHLLSTVARSWQKP